MNKKVYLSILLIFLFRNTLEAQYISKSVNLRSIKLRKDSILILSDKLLAFTNPITKVQAGIIINEESKFTFHEEEKYIDFSCFNCVILDVNHDTFIEAARNERTVEP